MAMTAAQVSADRRSLATQSAKSTIRIANAVRVINRARASMGSTLFSGVRSSILSLLGVDPEWHGIVGSLYGAHDPPDPCNANDGRPAYFVLRTMGWLLHVAELLALTAVNA